jgi:hypothetical protein
MVTWDDIGFLLGKNLGGSIVDRMQNSDLRKARQDLENYNGPTSEEINKARDALFNQSKDAGVGIIGLTPQEIVNQQKTAYDKAQNNLAWAQNNGYGDAPETKQWIQSMDTAHKNADYARRLAQIKGINMDGYSSNNPLNNDQGVIQNAVPQSQQEQPQKGLLGNLDFAPQYAATEKPQSQQGLFQSTIDKTATDAQKDYNRGNIITLNDIYKENGNSLDDTVKSYAEQLASARMKDPKYLEKLEDTLMSKGYDRNIINDVLKRASNEVTQMQSAEKESLTNQAYANIMKLAQTGDTKSLMAALPILLKFTGAKASDINTWAKNNQPEYKLDTTSLGGETVFNKFSANGMGNDSFATVRNSLSPNTEYTGKVSMRNNDNNNTTSQRITAMKETGQDNRLGRKLNYDAALYEGGFKGNKGNAPYGFNADGTKVTKDQAKYTEATGRIYNEIQSLSSINDPALLKNKIAEVGDDIDKTYQDYQDNPDISNTENYAAIQHLNNALGEKYLAGKLGDKYTFYTDDGPVSLTYSQWVSNYKPHT